jgi:hypothetical protein
MLSSERVLFKTLAIHHSMIYCCTHNVYADAIQTVTWTVVAVDDLPSFGTHARECIRDAIKGERKLCHNWSALFDVNYCCVAALYAHAARTFARILLCSSPCIQTTRVRHVMRTNWDTPWVWTECKRLHLHLLVLLTQRCEILSVSITKRAIMFSGIECREQIELWFISCTNAKVPRKKQLKI